MTVSQHSARTCPPLAPGLQLPKGRRRPQEQRQRQLLRCGRGPAREACFKLPGLGLGFAGPAVRSGVQTRRSHPWL